MNLSHNLAEDGILENEKLALIGDSLAGSEVHLTTYLAESIRLRRYSALFGDFRWLAQFKGGRFLVIFLVEIWSRSTGGLFRCPLRLVAQDSGLSVRRQRFESFRGC